MKKVLNKPDPATPTVAAPAPMNFAAESMSKRGALVWRERKACWNWALVKLRWVDSSDDCGATSVLLTWNNDTKLTSVLYFLQGVQKRTQVMREIGIRRGERPTVRGTTLTEPNERPRMEKWRTAAVLRASAKVGATIFAERVFSGSDLLWKRWNFRDAFSRRNLVAGDLNVAGLQ